MPSFPPTIETWICKKKFPQRCLISGNFGDVSLAIDIAATLLETSRAKIQSGVTTDCLLIADQGESFKIGDDQNPERDSARGVINWISQTPTAPHRVIIVERLERASREALQAWLKILEEPPSRAIFLLTTANHHQLPDTILSRVTTVMVPSTSNGGQTLPATRDFITAPDLGSRLQILNDLESNIKKNQTPKLRRQLVGELLTWSREKNPALLPTIFKADQRLQAQVNGRLVLEYLALKWEAKEQSCKLNNK